VWTPRDIPRTRPWTGRKRPRCCSTRRWWSRRRTRGPDGTEGDGADRRDHWVNGFVRKLPPGAQPSEKQMTLHERAVESEQVASPLAPGYTFVKKHHRNG
jgi:hypothetical protein